MTRRLRVHVSWSGLAVGALVVAGVALATTATVCLIVLMISSTATVVAR